MTTATDARLTAADRALLRTVFAWARANGWKHTRKWEDSGRDQDGAPWDEGTLHHRWSLAKDDGQEHEVEVWLDACAPYGLRNGVLYRPDDSDKTGAYWGEDTVRLLGARPVIDGLAALGVLPPELSSQWQAGRDTALDREEWRVMCTADGMRRPYPEPQIWTSNIATEADARLELSVAVSEGAWGEPFIQRRRVGASEWERVPDASV